MINGNYIKLFAITVLLSYIKLTDGSCNYPTEWQSSVWYDSYKGQLTFTTNQMSGWTMTSYASTISSWTCFNTEGDFIVSKSDSTVNLFGQPQDVYLCMKVSKISDFSYYYYTYGDKQVNANDHRVYVVAENTNVSSVQTVCSASSSIPTEEFHMLVKKDNVSDAKANCPTPLLGTFYYTHNNGSSDTCGTGSVWDVCTDRTTMTFNYTQCATVIAYSNEGQVYCVKSFTVGSTYYVSLINPGTVDNSNYYRFTCLVVTSSGDNVLASQSPNECETGQTAQTIPTNGAKLTLTPYVTCPFGSDTAASEESSGVAMGTIIGAVVAIIVLLIVGGIVGFVIYKKKCKGNKVEMYDKEEKENGPPEYISRGYTIVEDTGTNNNNN